MPVGISSNYVCGKMSVYRSTKTNFEEFLFGLSFRRAHSASYPQEPTRFYYSGNVLKVVSKRLNWNVKNKIEQSRLYKMQFDNVMSRGLKSNWEHDNITSIHCIVWIHQSNRKPLYTISPHLMLKFQKYLHNILATIWTTKDTNRHTKIVQQYFTALQTKFDIFICTHVDHRIVHVTI